MWENKYKQEFEEMLIKLDEVEDEKERERYRILLTKWYIRDFNKERSHSRKRDFRTFEQLDTPQITEKEKYKPSVITRLYWRESFEELLFSESPDDLNELVSDGTLSLIIDKLTPKQRQALFYIGVCKYSTLETGEELGVTDRNIRKLFATAVYHIKGKMYPIIRFRRKLETEEEYKEIAREKGIQTIHSQRKFVEMADCKVKNYYGKMTNDIEKTIQVDSK